MALVPDATPVQVDCGERIRNFSSYFEKCEYVKINSDCESSGWIEYSFFIYCCVPENMQWLGIAPLVLLLVVLFLGLSTAADAFFCPNLAIIVDHLSLSHNIAGVTFLAFGNGAPDIFASLASVLHAESQSAGLAFGALLGAGMFLSTVIVGVVTFVQPFDVMQRPLLRDLTFYLATIYWTFYILYKGRIRLFDALGFLALYVAYVIVVAAGRFIRKKMQARKKAEEQRRLGTPLDGQDFLKTDTPPSSSVPASDDETSKYDLFFANPHGRGLISPNGINDDLFSADSVSIADSEFGLTTSESKFHDCLKELRAVLAPVDDEKWRRASWYNRAIMVARAPILFTLTLTVPVVDSSKPNNNWSYGITLIQCVLSPIFALAVLQYFTYFIADVFPAAVIGLLISVLLGAAIGLTSKTGEPPVYHKFFAYFGFLMAVIWIYCLAREVVNILRTFGVVLNLSHEILGLTVLAWSNSLGDLISDITVAVQGYPRMAISACFGGPLFNILVGIGLPFTIAILSSGGGDINVPKTPVAQVLCVFLAASLISSFLILPSSRFRATRPYAIFLMTLYVTFLVVAVLTELKMIHSLW